MPGPSQSNRAPSFHRRPVTALPPQHHAGVGRDRAPDDLDELLQPLLVSLKREPDHVVALVLLGQFGFERLGLCRFDTGLRRSGQSLALPLSPSRGVDAVSGPTTLPGRGFGGSGGREGGGLQKQLA